MKHHSLPTIYRYIQQHDILCGPVNFFSHSTQSNLLFWWFGKKPYTLFHSDGLATVVSDVTWHPGCEPVQCCRRHLELVLQDIGGPGVLMFLLAKVLEVSDDVNLHYLAFDILLVFLKRSRKIRLEFVAMNGYKMLAKLLSTSRCRVTVDFIRAIAEYTLYDSSSLILLEPFSPDRYIRCCFVTLARSLASHSHFFRSSVVNYFLSQKFITAET